MDICLSEEIHFTYFTVKLYNTQLPLNLEEGCNFKPSEKTQKSKNDMRVEEVRSGLSGPLLKSALSLERKNFPKHEAMTADLERESKKRTSCLLMCVQDKIKVRHT
jgi:hypothetical protein